MAGFVHWNGHVATDRSRGVYPGAAALRKPEAGRRRLRGRGQTTSPLGVRAVAGAARALSFAGNPRWPRPGRDRARLAWLALARGCARDPRGRGDPAHAVHGNAVPDQRGAGAGVGFHGSIAPVDAAGARPAGPTSLPAILPCATCPAVDSPRRFDLTNGPECETLAGSHQSRQGGRL